MNKYSTVLQNSNGRLVNLFNLDPLSYTHGYADREYWGWKIKDFSNATLQGGIHSLSLAWKLNMFDSKALLLHIVDISFKSIIKMMKQNGSLEEAYPNENSYCVTALVAFDCLSAIRILDQELGEREKTEYLLIIKPLIRFIKKNKEKHAVITNHLATAAAALVLWESLTEESSIEYSGLLETIYYHQSEEGWYKEYEGADPGYQTLSLYYLASLYELAPNEKLRESVIRSIEYLKYFVHPDGSLGGLYGSRNTEVYYPGGLVYFSKISKTAFTMVKFLEEGINNNLHLTPDAIDINNFTTLLNSYAFAAVHVAKLDSSEQVHMPFQTELEECFPHAGIHIKSTRMYYSILNFKKGGTLKVFNKQTMALDMEDGGLAGRFKNGVRFSTQVFNPNCVFQDNYIKAFFYMVNESFPNALDTIIIRLFSLTVFRSVFLGNLFKKAIVNLLMTRKRRLSGYVNRRFIFGESLIVVEEQIIPPSSSEYIGHIGKFKAIHMASSGYFTKQYEQVLQNSQIVTFKNV